MIRKSGWTLVLASVVMVFIIGCAVGNKHAYQGVAVDLDTSGSSSVALATHDQRPYVVSGDKQADFVGLQRGGFGNPFNVTTLSENALAEDFSNVVAAALNSKGFRPLTMSTTATESHQSVLTRLIAQDADRLMLLTLLEWKSDTYQNTALKYNARVQLFDGEGKLLAEKTIVGEDDLKGSVMNPPGHAKKVIFRAFEEKLGLLLNDAEISKALQN
jgi:hypothetical protein